MTVGEYAEKIAKEVAEIEELRRRRDAEIQALREQFDRRLEMLDIDSIGYIHGTKLC